MKESRSTTQEERIQIVKDCIENGKNCGEMALKYKVSYQQVRTWVMHLETLGAQGLEDRRRRRKKDQTPRTALEQAQIEIEKLKHENYLLTMECNLLKNWTKSRREMPFASKTRASGQRSHRTAENEELAKKVEKIHTESPQF